MLKVTKKPKTPNMIWDAENNRPLCKFDRKGILETNDETLAEKLKAMGHVVTGEVDKVETPAAPDSEGDGEGAATPEGDAGEQNADGEPDANAEKTAATGKSRRSRK
jgi:hypothetical protein